MSRRGSSFEEAYANLVSRANSEDLSEQHATGAIQAAGVDNAGRPVFVFSSCNFPAKKDAKTLDKMLLCMVSIMDGIVKDQEYSIVYFHSSLGDDKKKNISVSWLRTAYTALPRWYKKNLKALYIVHASSFLKFFMTLLSPFISEKFWSKVEYISTLEELEPYVHVGNIRIPDAVKRYDDVAKTQVDVIMGGVSIDVDEPVAVGPNDPRPSALSAAASNP